MINSNCFPLPRFLWGREIVRPQTTQALQISVIKDEHFLARFKWRTVLNVEVRLLQLAINGQISTANNRANKKK